MPGGTENELDYLLCSDIFPTAWSCITSTGFQPGDTVAVYGAGPVGLLAAYSALLRGASKVYSIDHVPSRLKLAKSIGAIPIDLKAGDPADQIIALEPQAQGVKRTADCVGFECVNTHLEPQPDFVINNAIKLTTQNGGISITGVYFHGPRQPGEPNQTPKLGIVPVDIATVWIKAITIGGGIVTAGLGGGGQTLADMITAGRAKPSFVVDKVISIDKAPTGYKLFNAHEATKVVFKFGTGHTEDANGTSEH